MGNFLGIAKPFVENQQIFFIGGLILAFFLLFIWNIILQVKVGKRAKQLELGDDAKSLAEIVEKQESALKVLDKDIQELYNISNEINGLAFKGLHKFGMIRFNPFGDVGGDQSFALAMLNGKNNGIVLSSLYSREGTRIYAKSILNGEAEKYPLTNEEKKAIGIAKSQKVGKKI